MFRDVLDGVRSVGDEERRRIARDLHDDIGQRLAMLADDADRLRHQVHLTQESDRSLFDGLVLQARTLSEDLRRISHILHPSIVEDLGLVAALRALAGDFAGRNSQTIELIDFQLSIQVPLSISTTCYRITQEALHNIAKHAGKATVEIRLSEVEGELLLVISDSGRGFNPDQQTSFGLTSMRERVQLVGGAFNLTSRPNHGTIVHVRIPLSSSQSHLKASSAAPC